MDPPEPPTALGGEGVGSGETHSKNYPATSLSPTVVALKVLLTSSSTNSSRILRRVRSANAALKNTIHPNMIGKGELA